MKTGEWKKDRSNRIISLFYFLLWFSSSPSKNRIHTSCTSKTFSNVSTLLTFVPTFAFSKLFAQLSRLQIIRTNRFPQRAKTTTTTTTTVDSKAPHHETRLASKVLHDAAAKLMDERWLLGQSLLTSSRNFVRTISAQLSFSVEGEKMLFARPLRVRLFPPFFSFSLSLFPSRSHWRRRRRRRRRRRSARSREAITVICGSLPWASPLFAFSTPAYEGRRAHVQENESELRRARSFSPSFASFRWFLR